MAWVYARLIGVVIVLLAACSGDAGEDGSDGQPGTDGRDGIDGRSGLRGDAGPRGAAGPSGTSCTVTDAGDGVKTLSCEDGTSVTVRDGTDGLDGLDGEDGDAGRDGVDGERGADGRDGASCTLVVNADDTSTVTCGSDQVTYETPLCGNGQVARTEECDDAGESATCTADCTRMYEYAVLGNHYSDVKILDLTTRTWSTFQDAAYGSNGGGDVRHDGMLIFADYVFSGVHQIDPATGARSDFITGLGNPNDVEQASTGDIFVENGSTVARYDASGVFQANISVTSSMADSKLAAGPNGEMYYFRSGCPGSSSPPFCDDPDDTHTGEILRLDSGTAVLVSSGNLLQAVAGLAVDSAGTIWAATKENPYFGSDATIVTVDPSEGTQSSWTDIFGAAVDIEFDWNGDLLIATESELLRVARSDRSIDEYDGCPGPCGFRGMTYLRTSVPVP